MLKHDRFSLFATMDVHDRGIQVRSEAIGMLKVGITQINVARELQVTILIVKKWCSYRNGQIIVSMCVVV